LRKEDVIIFVGFLGENREVYRVGMGSTVEEIHS
jgi:hypothetical protein